MFEIKWKHTEDSEIYSITIKTEEGTNSILWKIKNAGFILVSVDEIR